jgi:hypothetical protein
MRVSITLSQMSSAVMKKLLSAKSRRKPLASIVGTVQSLEARLKQWRETCPSYLKPTIPIGSTMQLPPGVVLKHVLWLHFSYQAIMAAIHSRFTCPWNFSNIDGAGAENDLVRRQIEQSVLTVADTARKMILATRSITVDADAPCW